MNVASDSSFRARVRCHRISRFDIRVNGGTGAGACFDVVTAGSSGAPVAASVEDGAGSFAAAEQRVSHCFTRRGGRPATASSSSAFVVFPVVVQVPPSPPAPAIVGIFFVPMLNNPSANVARSPRPKYITFALLYIVGPIKVWVYTGKSHNCGFFCFLYALPFF
ncbi:hypothetical protein BS78_05G202000 [Paspalum vaginatum]|nr:hypothetical protein BS78_05G202000 [Paspalum vaginatum]